MRLAFYLLLTLSLTAGLYAQQPQVAVLPQYGRILKHTPEFAFEIPDYSYGIGLEWNYQTTGRHAWQHQQGFPMLGATVLYYDLGSEVLGRAVGILPHFTYALFPSGRWRGEVKCGSGVAYLTHPFDALTNPTNNAIGSHLNNITFIALGLHHRVARHHRLGIDGSFTHLSSGAASIPNYGLNIPAAQLTYRYDFKPIARSQYTRYSTFAKPPHRITADVYGALAFRRVLPAGGPRYAVYQLRADVGYQFSPYSRLFGGVEYEYSEAAAAFAAHVNQFGSAAANSDVGHRPAAFVGYEWKLGRWIGMTNYLGYYLRQNPYLANAQWYNRLAARVFLPPIGQPRTAFYLEVALKSHLSTADYISLGMGARIWGE